MGIWDRLKGELIDIIEWLDDTSDTMVWRFERYGNEIKNGAKLICRESQTAVLVSEGKLADVYAPGTHTLETKNMPILSTILGWKYGFASPFKAEVYFVSTKRFTDLKWGTMNPIMLRDAEFGPVRLRAFGTYALKVKDPAAFLREVVGTAQNFKTEGVTEQLRNMIVSSFTDVLGESRIPVLDLAGNYDELGTFISTRIQPDFDKYGVEVVNFRVENISLPPEVEKVLDQRTSMGIVGNLQAYMQFQTAQAIPEAAKNPGGGGLAAGGMGMGMGYAMGAQMGQAMGGMGGGGGTGVPPVAAGGAGGTGASGTGVPPVIPGGTPLQTTPPPVPMALAYYVAVGQQQTGPFDLPALKQKAAARELTRDTLVWKAGMEQWAAAGTVAELATLFSA